MSFKDVREILSHFHLNYKIDEFIDFEKVASVQIADWFREEIRFSLTHIGPDDKEAFISEFIIVPFLKEAWKRHPGLSLFSHLQICADDITVIPDYLISIKDPTGYKTLRKPLLLTVEAKNEAFEKGWGQALLQSVVCQKINRTGEIPVFSIVTTGDSWQFGKLDQNHFIKHPIPASLQDMEKLLGILDVLFSECEAIGISA
jgi:hypothetical protein